MTMLLVLALTGLQLGPGEPVAPLKATLCELALRPNELDGKIVSIRGHVIVSEHDTYMVAEGCSPGDQQIRYIFVWWPLKTPPGLRKFDKLMARSRRHGIRVTATFTGRVMFSPGNLFGFVHANVELQVLTASDLKYTQWRKQAP
jgi:trans-aconitate methyltransferase